ncbi:MAG: hypothetical protein LBJ76_04250 [Candidatus Accumulibacter sp.]|jgi:hypothetical protein|nr:hypothetical protein [Accumulibacter sp.]
MAELRNPKEVTIQCQDDSERTYIISKLPAIAGQKLVTQLPMTSLPKIGDYGKFEELGVELLGYVEAILPDGRKQRLSTRDLIDNHVPDWEALTRIQKEMAIYNVSFFQNGKLSVSFESIAQKVITWLAPMLTDLLQPSLANVSPLSAN